MWHNGQALDPCGDAVVFFARFEVGISLPRRLRLLLLPGNRFLFDRLAGCPGVWPPDALTHVVLFVWRGGASLAARAFTGMRGCFPQAAAMEEDAQLGSPNNSAKPVAPYTPAVDNMSHALPHSTEPKHAGDDAG